MPRRRTSTGRHRPNAAAVPMAGGPGIVPRLDPGRPARPAAGPAGAGGSGAPGDPGGTIPARRGRTWRRRGSVASGDRRRHRETRWPLPVAVRRVRRRTVEAAASQDRDTGNGGTEPAGAAVRRRWGLGCRRRATCAGVLAATGCHRRAVAYLESPWSDRTSRAPESPAARPASTHTPLITLSRPSCAAEPRIQAGLHCVVAGNSSGLRGASFWLAVQPSADRPP